MFFQFGRKPDGQSRPSRMAPLKPNLIAIVLGLLALAWMGLQLYNDINHLLTQISEATEVGEVQKAAYSVIGHLVSGGSIIGSIAAALALFGVKLLDERGESTVPASSLKETVPVKAFEFALEQQAKVLTHRDDNLLTYAAERVDNVTEGFTNDDAK